MAHRIGQRLLRDANNLALNAVAEAREFVDDHLDRHVGRALPHIRETFERRRDIFAITDVGTEGPDRPARFRQVCAGYVNRRLNARRDRDR